MKQANYENAPTNPPKEKMEVYENEKVRLKEALEEASKAGAERVELEKIIVELAELDANTFADKEKSEDYWQKRFDDEFERLEEVYLIKE
jgi:hypothetical protein